MRLFIFIFNPLQFNHKHKIDDISKTQDVDSPLSIQCTHMTAGISPATTVTSRAKSLHQLNNSSNFKVRELFKNMPKSWKYSIVRL